jgi:chromosome condensin MukBEF ATPase and DNA-binding subunit MukB
MELKPCTYDDMIDGDVDTNIEYYPKSEVDKVIADLEESHKMEVEQLLMEIVELKKQVHDYAQGLYVIQARAEKEASHHKYRHCLDMAYKCVVLCQKSKDLYRWAEDENLEHYYNHKIEFFARWHKRWLKLAEKFKEAK